MKKILAMFLALTMGCTMLAACGEEDSSSEKDSSSVVESSSDVDSSSEEDSSVADSSEPDESSEPDDSSKPEPSADGTKLKKLTDAVAENGGVTLTVNAEVEGQTMDMYIVAKEDVAYMEISVQGMKMVMFVDEKGTYLLDTKNKKYYDMGTEGLSAAGTEMTEGLTENADLVPVSTGNETINGKEYYVEAYKSADGTTVKYAFDSNDELCYMGGDVGGQTVYYGCKFEASVDESKLSIAGWTAMTDEEAMTLLYGM